MAKTVKERFEKYYVTNKGRMGHLLNNARQRSKRHGVKCTLTPEWIMERLEKGTCEITGLPFVMKINGGRGHNKNSWSPSIDRIDQKGDYSPVNCRMIVWILNRARGAFPDEDFAKLLTALQRNR